MKKYVLKDTNEVVDFGDIIELVLIKNNPDGTDKHKVKMVKFSEDLIPLLLEEGILDVQDDKDSQEELKKKPLIDFSKDDGLNNGKKEEVEEEDSEEDHDTKEFTNALVDVLEALDKSIRALDEEVYSLSKRVKDLEKRNYHKRERHPLAEKEVIAHNNFTLSNKDIEAINTFLGEFELAADE